jgi:hypothetical protein
MNELQAEYELLGLSPTANDEEIHAARRRVAFDVHPDRGGTTQAMAAVNAAFVSIMKVRRSTQAASEPIKSTITDSVSRDDPLSNPVRDVPSRHRVWSRDTPSFSINVLPVEAFEYLLLAAQELGDIVDSDPPYVLEVVMHVLTSGDVWCRLEVVPDAGSSTISLICESFPELGVSAESCRDQWVAVVNALDGALSD